jgi:glycosyltransferase involved in cell wall biosynthesis
MKIAIVLPDLRIGGVEKMRIILAMEWIKKGYIVEFILLQSRGSLLSDAKKIGGVVDLAAPRIRDALKPLVSHLRESKPEVLLVGMWPLTVLAVVAAKISASSTKVIVSEHIALSKTPEVASPLGRVLYAVTSGICYRMAQKVVAVSDGISAEIIRFAGLPQSKITVIPNPAYVDVPEHILKDKILYIHDKAQLLAVGTLKPQKGYSTLLRAIKIASSKEKLNLSIVGDGPDRVYIQDLINKYNLNDVVTMHGSQDYCHEFYMKSDIFILSSEYEGFGNVIVEALSYGLYVISTRCPHGPSEILRDGIYGSLVDVGDVDGLAESIVLAIRNKARVSGAIEHAKIYSPVRIASYYESVFLGTM